MDPIQLTNLLDELFTTGYGDWHKSVPAALSGVTAAVAAWRPGADLYSIWDLVNHMTYAIEMTHLRLKGRPRDDAAFAPPGHQGLVDWPAPANPPGAAEWQVAVERLFQVHKRLIARLRQMSAEQLTAPDAGANWPLYALVEGLVGHNSYHCGQILLLRRLHEAMARAAGTAADVATQAPAT